MSARREARERCLHMLYRVFPKERTRTDINWPGLIDGFVNIILGDDEPPVGKHFQRTDSGRGQSDE